MAGTPTRRRCQSVVSEAEASTGVELVAFYRVQEVISADNNIDARSAQFDKPFGPRGVAAEFLRREMANCNHDAYLAAETKLSELRKEAFELVQPIVKRLVKSLSDELNDAALAAESRLDKAGLPIRAGATWLLHDDVLIKALWSCRGKAETLLAALSHDNAIAVVQYLLTPEESTPFVWG
jgi:hypothetical protein